MRVPSLAGTFKLRTDHQRGLPVPTKDKNKCRVIRVLSLNSFLFWEFGLCETRHGRKDGQTYSFDTESSHSRKPERTRLY